MKIDKEDIIVKTKKSAKYDFYSELRSRPIFGGSGSGSDPSKVTRLRLRLRLQVNCKIENYEFVTIKKNLFS